MNEFGEFLYKLRKEKGMTQAELAVLLGVTNKAVSKWETGEAMPETSQLVPLSRIFNVTVDELLDGKREEGHGDSESIKDYLFKRGKDDSDGNVLLEKIQGALCSAVVFTGIIAYLLLGIIGRYWHPHWVIMPISAFLSGLIGIAFDIFNPKKREIKAARGENPYKGAICGTVVLLCAITYLLLGALLGLWHPLWIILVAGAFACAIIAMVIEIIDHKNKK